jgi:3-oxoacyl-[acyl-carrier-protein] synthase III
MCLKIDSIAVQFPSLRVSNADLLAQITECNPGALPEQIRRYQRELKHMMARSGSEIRYFRDRAKGETAMPLILNAVKDALAQAQIAAADVGLLIYCGVGRGFLEPAMAYFVADALGMRCECFDVLDACMSWVRALSIAYGLFLQKAHSHILIVNGELNIYESGYPALLKVDDAEKWRYSFPAFTIGEAATATLLSDSPETWNFHFRSTPVRVGLCTLPLAAYREFSLSPENLARNGPNNFMSFGVELSQAAIKEMYDFVHSTYIDCNQFDIWFPHAASTEACRLSAEQLSLGDKLYYRTFPLYGNLVSASIPAAMDRALKENRLTRGSKVVLCPASAGMSFALVDFVY